MALHCSLLISSRSTSRRLIYCSYRACVKQYLTTEWQRKDEWALALVGHVWRVLLLQKLDDLSWSPCGIPKWATTELRAMIYMGAQETPRRWRRRRNVLIKQANSISKSSRTNWETLDCSAAAEVGWHLAVLQRIACRPIKKSYRGGGWRHGLKMELYSLFAKRLNVFVAFR